MFGNEGFLASVAKQDTWETLARRLQAHPEAYVLLRGGRKDSRVFEAQGLPSQAVRRLVAKHFGREDEWQYVLYPRPESIEETLSMWERE